MESWGNERPQNITKLAHHSKLLGVGIISHLDLASFCWGATLLIVHITLSDSGIFRSTCPAVATATLPSPNRRITMLWARLPLTSALHRERCFFISFHRVGNLHDRHVYHPASASQPAVSCCQLC